MNDICRVGLMLGVLAVAYPGQAGEYHTGAKNICYDCHTGHDSQAHAYSGGPVRGRPNNEFGGGEDWLSAGPPNADLLKADVSEVCLACHDGMTLAPDVVGENSDNYVRQAGALASPGSAQALAGAADGETWGGHRLGVDAVPPGGSERMTLTCSSCHDPHGNDAYRNLRTPPDAGTARESWGRRPLRRLASQGDSKPIVSVAVGINDLSKDVFLPSLGGTNLFERYSVANVVFNEPKSGESAMDGFCRACHTAIHDPPATAGAIAGGPMAHEFVHPTSGAADRLGRLAFTFDTRAWRVGESPNGLPALQGQRPRNGSGAWPSHSAVTCLSCHKAHGNRNRHALILRSGRGPQTEEGDAAGVIDGQQALCGQCHETPAGSSILRRNW